MHHKTGDEVEPPRGGRTAQAEYTPSDAPIAAHDDEFFEWLVAQDEAGAPEAEILAAIELRHAEHMKRLHAGFAAWDAAELGGRTTPVTCFGAK